jgi:single-strand DNA-binding protein
MGSVNRVFLIGRLGADPELKFTANSRAVCNFSLATSETWKDKQSNEKQERTEWHKIVCWGDQAEHCKKYLAKGREACVEGKLQTRSYEDKEGKKRYVTEIVAERVTFLGSSNGERSQGGGDSDGGSGGRSSGKQGWGSPDPDPSNNGGSNEDGDIPF